VDDFGVYEFSFPYKLIIENNQNVNANNQNFNANNQNVNANNQSINNKSFSLPEVT
jgi:hypothetical protein